MIEWIGLAVAIVAAYFAWRANRKSDDANEIARRALSVSEREEQAQIVDRKARASLHIDPAIFGRESEIAEDGVLCQTGSGGQIVLVVTIKNDGDRDAGRTRVEVTLPSTMDNSRVRWSDARSQPLPAYPERAARIGDGSMLTRTLDRVARGVPEPMYFVVPIVVPDEGVTTYPIRIRVAAEGAEREAVEDLPLRVGRAPNP